VKIGRFPLDRNLQQIVDMHGFVVLGWALGYAG
jgi:hypothetical protein